MDNVGDDELHDGKAQLTQRDDGDVIGDGSDGEVRPKMEDGGSKTEFVLKTSEESQADVWIKARDPLSSEGSLPGRCNKAGDPLSSEGSLPGRCNKAGDPLSSEGSPAGRWNKVGVSYAEKGTHSY